LGTRTYLNLNHLNITRFKTFDLQPHIRERNTVVKRDSTVQCGQNVQFLDVKVVGSSRNQ